MNIDFVLNDITKEVFYANIVLLEKDIKDEALITARVRLKKMLEVVENSIKEMNDESL